MKRSLNIFKRLYKNLQIYHFVQDTLDKVGHKTHTKIIIEEEYDGEEVDTLAIWMAHRNDPYGEQPNVLIINPIMLDVLTNEELKATLLHEIGHLLHDSFMSNHDEEYAADRIAVGLGANPKHIISALAKIIGEYVDNIDEDSESHPCLLNRAKALKLSNRQIKSLLKEHNKYVKISELDL